MRRLHLAAAAVLVAAIVGAGLVAATTATTASATKLPVTTAREVNLTKLRHCASSMNGTTPVIKAESAGASTVTVNALPAACTGLPMTINLHNSTGAVIAQGSTASTTTSQTVSVGVYTAATVANAVATINGWVFPTAWTGSVAATTGCAGLDASGNLTSTPCTLTIGTVTTWKSGNYWYSQFQFTAQTAAPLWRVTFNFADTAKFQGFTPTVVTSSQNVALAAGYTCSQLPVFTGVEANPSWGSANGDLTITNDPAASSIANALCR